MGKQEGKNGKATKNHKQRGQEIGERRRSRRSRRASTLLLLLLHGEAESVLTEGGDGERAPQDAPSTWSAAVLTLPHKLQRFSITTAYSR
ncbi:unnamed protein product [Lampetra planeri]